MKCFYKRPHMSTPTGFVLLLNTQAGPQAFGWI